ncbi:MAG: Xaa-Pro peptidase family protein [Acidobacteria bacterium]|nr:Xaa-Pro peptidase family protein [Acidobacteriota bacterium]
MDTTVRLVLAGAGALIGILAPRYPHVTAMVFAALLTVVGGAGVLVFHGAEVWMVVALLPLLALGTLLLTRWLPRAGALLMLGTALALAVPTLTGGRSEARLPAIGVAAVLLIVGTAKPRWGVLMACATIGACLAWGAGPLVAGIGPWAVTLAAYLVLGGLLLHTRRGADSGPPWASCLRASLWVAAVLAVSLAALPLTARALTPTDGPGAERRARLQTEVLHGGLVWPLPSEALIWGDTDFPAFENLDALYLGDRADAGLVQLPGSSPARGRFALNGPIHRMRALKDAHEIDLLKRASHATVEALRRSLHLYRDGGYEGAIAEAVHYHFGQLGCDGNSFPPIVASGANALDFHYMKNGDPLVAGEAVITDIGCYVQHYASDYTRTLPVGGRFSPRVRELYDALDAAHRAAAAACRAGVYLRGKETPDGSKSLDTLAREVLESHGAPSDFGHGIGHPIGLFAHDVFPRREPLEAGMVVMIEPGIYIEDEGIGLRIENAYVVHEDGCELITGGIPTDAAGIERMMARAFSSPPDGGAPAGEGPR